MASPPAHLAAASPVRVCERTGLALTRYPRAGTWRVYKTTFGPLKGRPRMSRDPEDWGRFDLPGRSVLYTSTTRQGAYAEVLAQFKPKISQLEALASQVFDDVSEGESPIEDEWDEFGYMSPGNIPRVWRAERQIARVLLVDVPGWYIAVEDPQTLQALRAPLAAVLAHEHVTDLDVSTIRGPNRVITNAISEWVERQYLDDGSVPLGINYYSRQGSLWECWASFPDTLPRAGCGASALDINSDDDLRSIASLYGLHLH